jgi:hypothetical protein
MPTPRGPLALVGLGMVATLALALVGLLVDPRVITGAPAWLKPAKFAVSIALYSFTLLWLLTFVRGHVRLVRLVSWATAIGFVVEMAIIAGQAARGTTSHFNTATPLDGALFSIMGGFIVLVWAMGLLAAALLLRQRLEEPAFAWSLRLGLLISLIGMAAAVPMTMPTEAQVAAARSGGMPTSGAHTVGAPDGGPGLPVVGWSTEGGDMRVAHFVGLHGMQLLPAVGWLVSRRAARRGAARLGRGHRVALVWTAAGGYLGLVLLLAWQALRGQSVVAPDAATLTALAGLAAATGLAALAVLAHARRRPVAAPAGAVL